MLPFYFSVSTGLSSRGKVKKLEGAAVGHLVLQIKLGMHGILIFVGRVTGDTEVHGENAWLRLSMMLLFVGL